MKDDTRDYILHLRLTQAERNTLEKLATERGSKVSATVRDLIQEALIKRRISTA